MQSLWKFSVFNRNKLDFIAVSISSIFVVNRRNEFEPRDEALCAAFPRFGYEVSSRFVLSLEPSAKM